MRRTATALITATLLTAATLTGFSGSASAASTSPATSAAPARLTNLAHLDFLSDRVAVANTAAHNTYRLAQDPKIGVVWVYADSRPGGAFERVGGGDLNAGNRALGSGFLRHRRHHPRRRGLPAPVARPPAIGMRKSRPTRCFAALPTSRR